MEQTINIEELVQDDHNLNKGTAEGQRHSYQTPTTFRT